MKHEVVSVKVYIAVWAALCVLTLTTWQVALIDLGPFNIIAAITIAVVKMLLVVIIFMHVRQADALTRLYVGAGFLWLVILLGLFLMDYLSRSWLPGGSFWPSGPPMAGG
jgi:cytochrome c oxidase subunit 4